MEGLWFWLSLAVVSLATHGPRGSFIVLGQRARLPQRVQDALRFAPASALAAVVAPSVFLSDGHIDLLNPRLIAALVAIGVAIRWRNPWLPFLGGMSALWLTQAIFS